MFLYGVKNTQEWGKNTPLIGYIFQLSESRNSKMLYFDMYGLLPRKIHEFFVRLSQKLISRNVRKD
jgi:hypothetical protein